jgi:two-component system, OmpR family, response regulator VanR
MEYLKNSNLLFLNDDKITKSIAPSLGLFVRKVFLTKDSKKAFHLLVKEKINLIIVDSHLKNESGIDFIEKVRLWNEQIPIILISDYKNEEILFKVLTLKLSGYIVKPINYSVLIKAIEKCRNQIELKTDKLIELRNDFIYDKALKQVIKEKKYIN